MNQDMLDLLAAFNEGGVKYLVVGAHAVSVHAEPRGTKDLDIVVADTPENGRAVYTALAKYGAPIAGADPDNFWQGGDVFQVGMAPFRVDVLQHISGVDFEEAWPHRVMADFSGVKNVPVIGVEHLIRNKETAGRPQDIADVAKLRRLHKLPRD